MKLLKVLSGTVRVNKILVDLGETNPSKEKIELVWNFVLTSELSNSEIVSEIKEIDAK